MYNAILDNLAYRAFTLDQLGNCLKLELDAMMESDDAALEHAEEAVNALNGSLKANALQLKALLRNKSMHEYTTMLIPAQAGRIRALLHDIELTQAQYQKNYEARQAYLNGHPHTPVVPAHQQAARVY